MFSCAVNIFLALADKIPINLNFVVGRTVVESAVDQASIRTMISTNVILEKFPQSPWPKNIVDICKIISNPDKFLDSN